MIRLRRQHEEPFLFLLVPLLTRASGVAGPNTSQQQVHVNPESLGQLFQHSRGHRAFPTLNLGNM